MKVLMTGGTGFVGTTLSRELTARGHSVTVLMRKIESVRNLAPNVSSLEGDPTVKGAWQERVAEFDGVINLAGASIFAKWTPESKRAMVESRVLTTRNVVDALAKRSGKETHLFSTSAVGFYGFHGDEILDESAPPGTDFLAVLARDWESEALRAKAQGIRVVICRFGIVMGRNGGMLGEVVPLFRKRLGARLGSGRQWVSWIHESDLASVFLFLMERRHLEGPFNCTAPEPVRNIDLTEAIAQALDVSTPARVVPAFALKLARGEFASVILNGQRVIPRRLLEAGFSFRYPTIREALKEILARTS